MMRGYKGWPNRETANTNMWMFIFMPTLASKARQALREADSPGEGATSLKELAIATWGVNTPDGYALSKVKWEAIVNVHAPPDWLEAQPKEN